MTFEQRVWVDKIKVLHGRDATRNIGIYISDDGETWTLMETMQELKNEEYTYTIQAAAKYVKLERISGSTSWAAIRELYFI